MMAERQIGAEHCTACIGQLAHCHATLVLHADGSLNCSQADACDSQPDLHRWWITCAELASPCGCTGDEHPGAGRAGDGHLAQAA